MKNLLFLLILTLFLGGCAAISGYEDDIKNYNYQIYNKECEFDDDKKLIENGEDVLYTALKAGMRARICKKYDLSNKFFDIAEVEYKDSVDLKGFFASMGQGVGGTLLNDNTLDYDGRFYERVMINLYKALNFMTLGNFEYARVELNRALARQDRAKEYYENEILKAKNLLDEKARSSNTNSYNKAQMAEISRIYNNQIYQIYPNFINPFATYLSGLFFAINGDKKGAELLKESLSANPTNQQIKRDLELSKTFKTSPQIWLIYENGQSVGLRERVLHIPMFIISSQIYHTGIALPVLTPPKQSYINLELNGAKTTQIADMNAIINTEFDKILPVLVRKELLRAIFKTGLQYSASTMENGGDRYYRDYYGVTRQYNEVNPLAIFFGLYSALTTKADIRHIPVFPSNFQSVSVLNLGVVIIKDEYGNELLNLQTDKTKNIIIYLKSLTKDFFEYDKIEF